MERPRKEIWRISTKINKGGEEMKYRQAKLKGTKTNYRDHAAKAKKSINLKGR